MYKNENNSNYPVFTTYKSFNLQGQFLAADLCSSV